MRRVHYLVTALALAATAASAQPPGRPGGPLDIERLIVLLDLDAYQQGEVERILGEQREAMRATRQALTESDEHPSFEERQALRAQHQEALLTKLQAVLTENQITKFKVLTERPEGQRGPRGRGADGAF